ncbi:hypothetical protein [Streptomyces rubellomurinus]|uniref:Uncharacterized protein n=2 Tax=Streptomyces TaxID=1883 RepID=A0A0F2TIQ0_STRR3|nr:hypothetical protein [Streptomyces rubellomurinus]KJS55715.1 hypothetical protein VM98_11630 [Streptomyces rubellomurinus subsp. indigoferus]KJS61587.1 hypothetical protein VM95_14180 [Streptomyces rubellomurinus]
MTALSFTVPLPAPTVPPRREVPSFPPIRRGCGGWHRWRAAVRRRAGPALLLGLALVLLAVAAALASGPARAGLPPPIESAVSRTGCQSTGSEDHP